MINTNLASLVSQQHQRQSQSSLQTAMERLSSGLRINSAKDDAAGQAIANRMTSQINGYAQAQRNANDGISLAQTVEGALDKVNENLQRVRQLTIQSLNATNNEQDLFAIQEEVNACLEEVDRISRGTEFNGKKILNGEVEKIGIQVGPNNGDSIEIDLNKINSNSLGVEGLNVAGSSYKNFKTVDIENDKATSVLIESKGFSQVGEVGDGVKVYAADANPLASFEQVLDNLVLEAKEKGSPSGQLNGGYVTLEENSYFYSFIEDKFYRSSRIDVFLGEVEFEGSPSINTAGQDVRFGRSESGKAYLIDNVSGRPESYHPIDSTMIKNGVISTNLADSTAVSSLGAGAVVTSQSSSSPGESYFTAVLHDEPASTREDLVSEYNNQSTSYARFQINGDYYSNDSSLEGAFKEGYSSGQRLYFNEDDEKITTNAGSITYYEDSDGILRDGESEGSKIIYVDGDGELTKSPTRKENVAYDLGEATKKPIEKLDMAIGMVDELRSEMGSVQNRLESAASNISVSSQNLLAARSRIEDADYAIEVADLTKAKILQQAGISIMVQSNQVPQTVLSLLRGLS